MTAQTTPAPKDDRLLIVGVVAICCAILPVIGFAIWSLNTVIRSQSTLESGYTQAALQAGELRSEKLQQNAFVPIYVITGQSRTLVELRRADQAFASTLAQMRRSSQSRAAAATLARIDELQAQLLQIERVGVARRQAGASIATVNAYFGSVAGPVTSTITRMLDRYADQTREAYELQKARTYTHVRQLFLVVSAAGILCLVFVLAMASAVARAFAQKRRLDQLTVQLAQRDRDLAEARKTAVEVVSHDLRSPLTAIVIGSEVLREQLALSATPRQVRLLNTIRAAAESMQSLVENVLDQAKIEAGALELDLRPTDIGELVESVELRFRLLAERKQVHLVNALSPTLPTLKVDPGRIDQVVSNLVANAIKFTQPGGEVRLSAETGPDDLRLHVSDTGIGMTQEQAARTFDRFWQARETASLGSGLGMAISKAIVEAHGGRLSVLSQLGEGTNFTVELPM